MQNELNIEDHLGLVKLVALSYVKDKAYIQDTDEYSDGLLGLWDAVQNFDGRGEFHAYAIPCIRNRILEGYRYKSAAKRKLNLLPNDFDIPSQEQTMETECDTTFLKITKKDNARVRKYKKVLSWYFLDKMTYDQIGVKLGITKQAVGQIKNKAITWAKDKLAA